MRGCGTGRQHGHGLLTVCLLAVRGVGEGRRAPPVTSHALIILITGVRASPVPWRLILPSEQQSLSTKTITTTKVGQ